MTTYEIGGLCVVEAAADLSLYQYYRNGLLTLSDEGNALLQNVPESWKNGPFVRAVMEALGQEYEMAQNAMRDVSDQLYVQTATWGLTYWEQMLGIPSLTGLDDASLTVRRLRILTSLARADDTSSAFFLSGLNAIAGGTVVMTMLDPYVNPYTVRIEAPIAYFEEDPDVSSTTAASDGSGAISAGTYIYRITYVLPSGETTSTSDITCPTFGSSSKVKLSNVPVSPDNALARNIYRKLSGGPTFQLVGTISNNVDTLYEDNSTSPGVSLPSTNTAKTQLALQLEDYVKKSKPSHIHTIVGSTGFRAGIDGAGDPV